MYRFIQESQTLLINTQSKELASQNKKIIKFGFGQSPFSPPKPVIEALKNSAHLKYYTSVQGDEELREHVSSFHSAYNGLKSKADNILIAPGSKILINNILMAYCKADIFIPAPSWVSYAPQATLAGHNVIRLNTSFNQKWRITASILSDSARQKRHSASILILNYPGNPDGLTYSDQELTALAEMARKLDIMVISDEIYGLLNHQNNHYSFGNYYPERTITTTGLSKWCGAGGWRLGVALLYDDIEIEFKKALIGIGSETYSCAPTPVQMAAKIAYGNFEDSLKYVKRQNYIYSIIGNYCSDKLNQWEISVHNPEGAFYMFPDFSKYQKRLSNKGITTSDELCKRILTETGVALLPATAFGFKENFMAVRLAYVDFEEPLASKTFELDRDAKKIVQGIEAIGDWVAQL